MILKKEDVSDKIAAELELRSDKLKSSGYNHGNEDVVFAIAQLIRVLGKANSSSDKYSKRLLWLTIATTILIILQIFFSLQTTRPPCTFFDKSTQQFSFVSFDLRQLSTSTFATTTVQRCISTINLGFFGTHTWITDSDVTSNNVSYFKFGTSTNSFNFLPKE